MIPKCFGSILHIDAMAIHPHPHPEVYAQIRRELLEHEENELLDTLRQIEKLKKESIFGVPVQ